MIELNIISQREGSLNCCERDSICTKFTSPPRYIYPWFSGAQGDDILVRAGRISAASPLPGPRPALAVAIQTPISKGHVVGRGYISALRGSPLSKRRGWGAGGLESGKKRKPTTYTCPKAKRMREGRNWRTRCRVGYVQRISMYSGSGTVWSSSSSVPSAKISTTWWVAAQPHQSPKLPSVECFEDPV